MHSCRHAIKLQPGDPLQARSSAPPIWYWPATVGYFSVSTCRLSKWEIFQAAEYSTSS